jgi:hypothetical protein
MSKTLYLYEEKQYAASEQYSHIELEESVELKESGGANTSPKEEKCLTVTVSSPDTFYAASIYLGFDEAKKMRDALNDFIA